MKYSIVTSRLRGLHVVTCKRYPQFVICTSKECGMCGTSCVGVECYNNTWK